MLQPRRLNNRPSQRGSRNSWRSAMHARNVMPAQAGIQSPLHGMGSRLRGNDEAVVVRMSFKRWTAYLVAIALVCIAGSAWAQNTGLPALTSTPSPGGGQTYSLSVQTLILLTSLSFLPALLLMMTSFTRIIIVLSLLRQALCTPASRPIQWLIVL